MRVNTPLPGACTDCRASAISSDGGSSFSSFWFDQATASNGNDQGAMLRGVPLAKGQPAPIYLSTRVAWKQFNGNAAVLTSLDDGRTFPRELAVPVFLGSMKYSALAQLPGDGPGGINTTHIAMLFERGPPDHYANVGVAIVRVPSSHPPLRSDDDQATVHTMKGTRQPKIAAPKSAAVLAPPAWADTATAGVSRCSHLRLSPLYTGRSHRTR